MIRFIWLKLSEMMRKKAENRRIMRVLEIIKLSVSYSIGEMKKEFLYFFSFENIVTRRSLYLIREYFSEWYWGKDWINIIIYNTSNFKGMVGRVNKLLEEGINSWVVGLYLLVQILSVLYFKYFFLAVLFCYLLRDFLFASPFSYYQFLMILFIIFFSFFLWLFFCKCVKKINKELFDFPIQEDNKKEEEIFMYGDMFLILYLSIVELFLFIYMVIKDSVLNVYNNTFLKSKMERFLVPKNINYKRYPDFFSKEGFSFLFFIKYSLCHPFDFFVTYMCKSVLGITIRYIVVFIMVFLRNTFTEERIEMLEVEPFKEIACVFQKSRRHQSVIIMPIIRRFTEPTKNIKETEKLSYKCKILISHITSFIDSLLEVFVFLYEGIVYYYLEYSKSFGKNYIFRIGLDIISLGGLFIFYLLTKIFIDWKSGKEISTSGFNNLITHLKTISLKIESIIIIILTLFLDILLFVVISPICRIYCFFRNFIEDFRIRRRNSSFLKVTIEVLIFLLWKCFVSLIFFLYVWVFFLLFGGSLFLVFLLLNRLWYVFISPNRFQCFCLFFIIAQSWFWAFIWAPLVFIFLVLEWSLSIIIGVFYLKRYDWFIEIFFRFKRGGFIKIKIDEFGNNKIIVKNALVKKILGYCKRFLLFLDKHTTINNITLCVLISVVIIMIFIVLWVIQDLVIGNLEGEIAASIKKTVRYLVNRALEEDHDYSSSVSSAWEMFKIIFCDLFFVIIYAPVIQMGIFHPVGYLMEKYFPRPRISIRRPFLNAAKNLERLKRFIIIETKFKIDSGKKFIKIRQLIDYKDKKTGRKIYLRKKFWVVVIREKRNIILLKRLDAKYNPYYNSQIAKKYGVYCGIVWDEESKNFIDNKYKKSRKRVK